MVFDPPSDTDPIELFLSWYDEAVRNGLPFADAMALATCDPSGHPSVRMVLFRGMSGGGLRFFTNLESRKARELAGNDRAAVVFHWAALERQVRIEGRVELLDGAEADAYFQSRPRGSQLSAWASPQSRPVEGRDVLEAAVLEQTEKYRGRAVPRPPFWSGYRLLPDSIEFWVGSEHRLHDRVVYSRGGDHWTHARLGP